VPSVSKTLRKDFLTTETVESDDSAHLLV